MRYAFYFVLSLMFFSCTCEKGLLVHNQEELNSAIEKAMPGDVITLAAGVWKNVEIHFEGAGTSDAPITLTVEEKGKVTLEGQSFLTISGEHLVVDGLVFKNGYTPTSEVISFRRKKGVYGNNCRVTECVIDNYNSPERFESATWIAIYGKNNRVDHCYMVDKRTLGVTMTVRMVDEACRENNHRIDHNYFGYRQNLGSNGGETLRLGTSHYSLFTCGTTVENNYFEHCDGEHEIISNKSCGNNFINNTFKECRGTLTYRHGNDNVAEGNFFFGNGKEHTGGIRIINKRNKAINNYFSDLTGFRFRGALVIMNGVPNSAINRYHQVDGGIFKNNTFINCDYVQLCAGSDDERTATPINSIVENNLFYHDRSTQIFTVYDDVSGIAFKNNVVASNMETAGLPLTKTEMTVGTNEKGLKIINSDATGVGCTLEGPVATADNCGVTWYDQTPPDRAFGSGKIIQVGAGQNTIFDAVQQSAPGDVIVLTESGDYFQTKKMKLNHPVSIIAGQGVEARLSSEKEEVFVIENEGALKLQGIEINGSQSPDLAGNCIISTSHYSMNCNYNIQLEDCVIKDLDVNHSFDFIKTYKNTMADTVLFRNCTVSNVTGHLMRFDAEVEDLGIFNAEYVLMENSTFKDIQGVALNLYRGGTDESTFGPTLKINACNFENVGNGKRNKLNASLAIHGVQVAYITNSNFRGCKAFDMHLTNGEPITEIENCEFTKGEALRFNNKAFKVSGLKVNGVEKSLDKL